ncbi:hypothetical protein [Pseudomonas sp. MWU12-2345]|uniref:hypothetical protein n=1 Tax=Pseudomonas sp. MWU12-2345 TaxID=2928689 RepID=UPI00200D084C|nr:hypothetical protein [Pseudomonas sp. MWU12-2345]
MASKIEMLEGVVSHVSRGTKVHGSIQTSAITGKTSGSMSSGNVYAFRVNGRPVEFLTSDAVSLADGDTVRVAGTVKKGHLVCYALKNFNTQAEHNNCIWGLETLGYFIMLSGIPAIVVVIGLVLVPLGVALIIGERRKKKCIAMVAKGVTSQTRPQASGDGSPA